MMKPYQYPTRRSRGKAPTARTVPRQPTEQATLGLGLIQGRIPGSKEEWWVSRALDRLRRRYRYQVPVMGGRRLRGGQVLDFLIEDPPLDLPLQVMGEYWHKGQLDPNERFNLAMIAHAFGREPEILWAGQVQDEEETFVAVRELLG